MIKNPTMDQDNTRRYSGHQTLQESEALTTQFLGIDIDVRLRGGYVVVLSMSTVLVGWEEIWPASGSQMVAESLLEFKFEEKSSRCCCRSAIGGVVCERRQDLAYLIN